MVIKPTALVLNVAAGWVCCVVTTLAQGGVPQDLGAHPRARGAGRSGDAAGSRLRAALSCAGIAPESVLDSGADALLLGLPFVLRTVLRETGIRTQFREAELGDGVLVALIGDLQVGLEVPDRLVQRHLL